MAERNKALVRRAIDEVFNGADYAVVDELVSDDIVVHTSMGDLHGAEALKGFHRSLRSAFPDIGFQIEDQIAEGDRVVTRWSATATHSGDFQGIPPTGKWARVTGVDIDRIVGDRVVECWSFVDDLGLLQQLGVMPAATTAS